MDAIIAELRELLSAASEPSPRPTPEQDSRVGEAMVARHDTAMIDQWRQRRVRAGEAIVAKMPALLDQIETERAQRLAQKLSFHEYRILAGDHSYSPDVLQNGLRRLAEMGLWLGDAPTAIGRAVIKLMQPEV